MKKILWTALALMVISACEKDPTLNDKFWEEAPLEMEQHQFQIETEVLSGLYWHWNNASAFSRPMPSTTIPWMTSSLLPGSMASSGRSNA